jgi:DNA-binding transcriptional LysR family regulator
MDLVSALKTFLRVAATGSFSSVASERGVSQPSISRQINSLERHLGTILLHRTTHAVILTAEGRLLVPQARELVSAAEALIDVTGGTNAHASGTVRIGVPVSLGLFVSSRLTGLLDAHPKLSLDLVLRDGPRHLVEDGLDLELCIGSPPDSSFVSRLIGQTTAFLVASEDYLSRRGTVEHPTQLQNHDCIVHHRVGRPDVWVFSSRDGEVAIQVPARVRVSDAVAVYRAVVSGQGIGLLSHILVADDIGNGQLRKLLPDFPPVRYPIHVLYPTRHLPLRTRVVIDHIASAIRDDPFMQ